MNRVVDLKSFRGASTSRALVVVDMVHDRLALLRDRGVAGLDTVMTNCTAAIRHARANRIPVAFARLVRPVAGGHEVPRWLTGFEPVRSDMVFERDRASCYANALFDEVVSRYGNFALAGLGGETACLATLIDASHRGHHAIYLGDASISNNLDPIDGGEVHRVVVAIAEQFGDVATTGCWIAATSRRGSLSGRGKWVSQSKVE